MKHLLRITLIVSVVLIGCGQGYVQGTIIQSSPLLIMDDQSVIGGHDDYYNVQGPTIILASSLSELDHITSFIPQKNKELVRQHNIQSHIVLALFDGERFTSGYAVQIVKILYQESNLYIYTHFIRPKPEQLVQPSGPRSACFIVSIERSALPANVPLTVHLMDDATKQEVLVQEYIVK